MGRLKLFLALAALAVGIVAAPLTASGPPRVPEVANWDDHGQPDGRSELLGAAAGSGWPGVLNSDLAFWGRHSLPRPLQRVPHPSTYPRRRAPGRWRSRSASADQGDVAVWDDILIRSWNSPTRPGRTLRRPTRSPKGSKGLHVFDISNLPRPPADAMVELESAAPTPSRSHPTVGNDLADRLQQRVQRMPTSSTLVEAPLDDPASAHLLRIEPLEGPVTPGVAVGCHDMGVNPGSANPLAACASADATNVFDVGRNRFPGRLAPEDPVSPLHHP